jgi:hypothetical protein
VLVAGGFDNGDSTSAELYDPATESWTLTGSLNAPHSQHTASLLNDGKVLVAGGASGGGDLRTSELYDPVTGSWTLTTSLNEGRVRHTATLLSNGEVLVAGGDGSHGLLNTAELYDFEGMTAPTVTGRGAIAGQDGSATFNLRAVSSGDRPTGSLSFSDPAAGVAITKSKIRTLTFNGNSADLTGVARLEDGTKVNFSVSVSDLSSDGSTDTFSISLSNGYSASGTLISGDIKIQ